VLIRYVFKNQATEKAMTVDKKKFFTNRKQALRAFCESTASYQSGMTNHEMEYLVSFFVSSRLRLRLVHARG
jgi:hypothetical protein